MNSTNLIIDIDSRHVKLISFEKKYVYIGREKEFNIDFI